MLTGTYSYTETTTNVTLTIPLKGTSPQALDVLLTKATLRVSFLPFLIDLCLAHDVDDANSKAVLKDGILTITLFKLESKLWGDLLYDGTKDEITNRRDVALAERTARVQRKHQEVLSRKVEEERMTLRTQMALEENERQMIDDKKAEEKQAAEQELYKAFVEMEMEKQKKEPESVDDIAASSDATTTIPAVDDASATRSAEGNETNDASPATSTSTCAVTFTRTCNADEMPISIPPPRKAVRSTFKHTPRLFKTPSRESTVKQEKEFLVKNRSHLHASITGKDVAESDPMWLLQKGDKFLSNGDYRSAINAYSSALEADDTLAQALSSRATCHLHLRSDDLCKADCCAALALLEKGDGGTSRGSITTGTQEICTSKLELSLLRTRSVARMHLGDYQGSINDKIKAKGRLGPDDGAALQELDMEIAAVESQNQALQ